ncbi:Sperm-associated antigen 6, partial [Rhizophlyctis rosea]
LTTKTKRALKCNLEKTLHLDALEPLLSLSTTPPNILKYVVAQFAKILPHDVGARRMFVTSGGLQRIQEIASAFAGSGAGVPGTLGQQQAVEKGGAGLSGLTGTKMGEYIMTINGCYPEEIVRYYSPGYSATLLDKIDEYTRSQDYSGGGRQQSQQQHGSQQLLPPLPGQDAGQQQGQQALPQGITA